MRGLKEGGKGNSDPEVQAAVQELLTRKAAVERLQVGPFCTHAFSDQQKVIYGLLWPAVRSP